MKFYQRINFITKILSIHFLREPFQTFGKKMSRNLFLMMYNFFVLILLHLFIILLILFYYF